MKRTIFIFCSILFIANCLSAQNNKPVTVKAGEKISDYFPVNERYRYPDFTEGQCIFKNGRIFPDMFNYNFLSGEMEFIQLPDTMIISNKKDIRSVAIAQDTFYYHNGYLEMIRSGQPRVYLKQRILLKEILRKGAMGTVNRNSASESLDHVVSGGISYNMRLDEDMVFQKTSEYFFSTPGNDFIQFNRKNIIRILPGKEEVIKKYLKSEKIDFESREDILKLAEYVSNILYENPKIL